MHVNSCLLVRPTDAAEVQDFPVPRMVLIMFQNSSLLVSYGATPPTT
jgi:hypothetical protein